MTYDWNVTFTGDYVNITTIVAAETIDQAILYARTQLEQHHGIDTENIGIWHIEAECEAEWARA